MRKSLNSVWPQKAGQCTWEKERHAHTAHFPISCGDCFNKCRWREFSITDQLSHLPKSICIMFYWMWRWADLSVIQEWRLLQLRARALLIGEMGGSSNSWEICLHQFSLFSHSYSQSFSMKGSASQDDFKCRVSWSNHPVNFDSRSDMPKKSSRTCMSLTEYLSSRFKWKNVIKCWIIPVILAGFLV